MDQLRKGIHLRGYAQKNPEQEYKRESFELFKAMLGAIKSDVVQDLARVHIPTPEEIAQMEEARRLQAEAVRLNFEHNEMGLSGEMVDDDENTPNRSSQTMTLTLGATSGNRPEITTPQAEQDLEIPANISRNAPCPCGSGLKYKQCHGKLS